MPCAAILNAPATGCNIGRSKKHRPRVVPADLPGHASGGQPDHQLEDLIFDNESNDRMYAGEGNKTVFGGQGKDIVLSGSRRDTIRGN